MKFYSRKRKGCIFITTINGDCFSYSSTLKQFAKYMNDDNFVKVHRSYYVNTRFLDSIDKNEVIIRNVKIPLSDMGYNFLMNRINRFKSKP